MTWHGTYKLTATTLAAVCAFTVHASFELVLVADDTNKLVHRYDGGSGILLGTFGGGGFLTAARGVAVDQANNTAFVLEGTSCAKFNYNTGEFLGDSFFLGFNATEMTRLRDGSILLWGANNCARYSTSGAFLSFYGLSSGYTIKEGALGPDGRIYLTTNDGAGTQRTHWFPLSGGSETANTGWLNDNLISDSTYC